MKRKLWLILTALMLCTSIAQAEIERDGLLFEVVSDTEKTVKVLRSTTHSGYSGDIVVPATIKTASNFEYTVVELDKSAFNRCFGLTSITLPKTLKRIGEYAFYGCNHLTSIQIPSSVTSIGSMAFDGCTGLERVDITDLAAWCSIAFERWEANPLSIARKLYLNGQLLTQLAVPSPVKAVGAYAFSGLDVEKVSFASSVNSIGSHAFFRATIGELSLENITSLGKYSFSECQALKTVTLPSSLLSVESGVFSDCKDLTTVKIQSSLTAIPFAMFDKCVQLVSVNIPGTVKSIDSRAFFGCFRLREITIPASVQKIDSQSFTQCYFTTFDNQSSLSAEKNDNWGAVIFDGAIVGGLLIEDGVLVGYIGDDETVVVPHGVEAIADNAFYYNRTIRHIVLPSTLTSIGESAFCKSSLVDIDIPNSVVRIGKSAFFNCFKLESIRLPQNLTTLESFALTWAAFTKVQLPASVKVIKTKAINLLSNNFEIACESEIVPETDEFAFGATDKLSSKTLYVPEASLEAYRNTAPWSYFGTIKAMEKCDVPKVQRAGKKLLLSCSTPDATYDIQTSLNTDDAVASGNTTLFNPVVTFTIRACKVGYLPSDPVTYQYEADVCDVNGDGVVTSDDVKTLVDMVLGK